MTTAQKTPNAMPYVSTMFAIFAVALALSIPIRITHGDATADHVLIGVTSVGLVGCTLAYVLREPRGEQ